MTPAAFEALRVWLGISRVELADRLEVSERTIRLWGSGQREIPIGIVEKLRNVWRQANDVCESMGIEYEETGAVVIPRTSDVKKGELPALMQAGKAWQAVINAGADFDDAMTVIKYFGDEDEKNRPK